MSIVFSIVFPVIVQLATSGHPASRSKGQPTAFRWDSSFAARATRTQKAGMLRASDLEPAVCWRIKHEHREVSQDYHNFRLVEDGVTLGLAEYVTETPAAAFECFITCSVNSFEPSMVTWQGSRVSMKLYRESIESSKRKRLKVSRS